MSATCPARADLVNTQWAFCSSLLAAYLFTALFALATLAHLSQAIIYKKPYCWLIVVSAFLHTTSYIFRIVSIEYPTILGLYAVWFVLMLVAPLFTNVFVFIFMERMIWSYTQEAKIYGVTAWKFRIIFVALDICALIIQVTGASNVVSSRVSTQDVLRALYIYMAGIGLQQCLKIIFVFFSIKFHGKILHELRQDRSRSQALNLLYTLYAVLILNAVLILITVRIISRLCEYAQGLHSSIPIHEAYQYCLDSLPMFIALLLLNAVHPNRVMFGKESDVLSRKERRFRELKSKGEEEDGRIDMQSF